MEHDNLISELQSALSALNAGNYDKSVAELNSSLELINRLMYDIKEINDFSLTLSEGKMESPLPNRSNRFAGPIKQLHSQFSTLVYSMKQLKAGKIISKLEPTGELNIAFNNLIDYITSLSIIQSDTDKNHISHPQNNWKYHQFMLSLDNLHVMVLEVDITYKIVYANRLAKTMLGDLIYLPFPNKKCNSQLLTYLTSINTENKKFPSYAEIFEIQNNVWYKISSDSFFMPNNQHFFLYMIENINDQKTNENQLRYSASVDAMTGVYNRKTGINELIELLDEKKHSEIPHCVTFIDIDGLKQINDIYGHQYGDYAILNISRILLSSIRKNDIISRYGGDEFFLILKNRTKKSAKILLEQTQKKLSDYNKNNPKPFLLSFSFGIVEFNGKTSLNALELLNNADKLMYDQKIEKKSNLQNKSPKKTNFKKEGLYAVSTRTRRQSRSIKGGNIRRRRRGLSWRREF